MIFIAQQKKDPPPQITIFVTSIGKTLQRVLNKSETPPKFTEEVLFKSVINIKLPEGQTEFNMKQAFYHKDFGLFILQTPEEKNFHLYYIPRTSLFTGKSSNQYFKFEDFRIQANPWLQKELAFFSSYENQYHLYLAKDLFKDLGQDSLKDDSTKVFEKKNTQRIKEKFQISSTTFDFKMSLLQEYCSIVNMSNEVMKRPYLNYYFKANNADEVGIIRPIDKFETINLNPYVIIVEDKSTVNIYSMIVPNYHYFFKIEGQFLQFIDLPNGSISLENKKYYKHQVCLYLTQNSQGQQKQQKINCLILPSYSEMQEIIQPLKLCILPLTLDWPKYIKSQIIKSFFVQFTNKDKNQYLILQQHANIVVFNINNPQQKILRFSTSSCVLMLLQHPEDTISNVSTNQNDTQNREQIMFYVHSSDQSQQTFSILKIDSFEPPKMINILDYNGPRILKIQQIESSELVIFDENLSIKKFKIQENMEKVKASQIVDEFKINEDAKKIFNNPLSSSPRHFELTNNAVYINHHFYQILKNQTYDGNMQEFENQRKKIIDERINENNMCLGPYMSTDKQNLIYIFKGNNERNDHFDNYQILEVPLLIEKNQQSLLHLDDYQKELVMYSTFTPQDDIVLILEKNQFLIFDIHGNLLLLENMAVLKDIEGQNFLQCQIGDQNTNSANEKKDKCLFFLFEQEQLFEVLTLERIQQQQDKMKYQYKIKKLITITKLKFFVNVNQLFRVRIAEDGALNQLRIFHENNTVSINFNQNGQKNQDLVDKIFQKIRNSKELLRTQIQTEVLSSLTQSAYTQSFNIQDDQTKQSLIDDSVQQTEIVQEASLDYDFLLLPPNIDKKKQYFVLKRNLQIYYIQFSYQDNKRILEQDSFTEVNLDLNKEGKITQILTTSNPDIVQFVYIQERPLQQYVFTWDLNRNLECQMHTYMASADIPFVITRGVTTRENYLIPQNEKHIFDLRFQFPNNIFNGQQANLGWKKFQMDYHKDNKQEYKVAANSSALLGLSQQTATTIQYPYTYIALQYAQYIIEIYNGNENKVEEIKLIKPILKFMKLNLQNETNILHELALKESFLKLFAQEIRNQLIDLNNKDALAFVYYVLMPSNTNNKNGRRPLSKAIQQHSPKCLEQMIEMLALDTKQDYMRYIERHILKLLKMNSQVFLKFFNTCCQKFQFRKQGLIYNSISYIQRQSQYINQTLFIDTLQAQVDDSTRPYNQILFPFFHCRLKRTNKKNEGKEDNNQNEKNNENQNSQISESENDEALSNDSDHEQQQVENKKKRCCFALRQSKQTKNKSIDFYSYDFDHITNNCGAQLIEYISSQPLNSPIFESPTVQAYLAFQWQRFKWQYLLISFLYLVSFSIMIPYFLLLQNALREQGNDNNNFMFILKKHQFFFFIFLPSQFSLAFYLTIYEWKKMLATKDMWQILIVVYNFWQAIIPIFDMVEYIIPDGIESPKLHAVLISLQHGLNANFIILGLLVFLYKIKYLKVASFFIARLFLVIKDIFPLLILITITEFIFSYSYRIIYEITPYHTEGFGITFKAFSFFFESTFDQLWQFWTKTESDQLTNVRNASTFWLLVVLTAMVIVFNILILNFMIAAIIESYNKVTKHLKNLEYLSRAKALFENSLLFGQFEAFQSTRYVLKAQVQSTADQDSAVDWDVLTSGITSSVKTTIQKEQQRNDEAFKFMTSKIDKLNTQQAIVQQLARNAKIQQQEIKEQMQMVMIKLEELERKTLGGQQPSLMISNFKPKNKA